MLGLNNILGRLYMPFSTVHPSSPFLYNEDVIMSHEINFVLIFLAVTMEAEA